jgi:hypothetical protein
MSRSIDLLGVISHLDILGPRGLRCHLSRGFTGLMGRLNSKTQHWRLGTQPIKKNHAAIASEAVTVFESIEKRIIPRAPVDRDELLDNG